MSKEFTITNFLNRFPTNDACLEEIKKLRWGNIMTCPKCEKESNFYRVKGRTAYACQFCGHHLYPLAGTIFDKTSTPLTLWFYAIYLMAQTRSGISAKQLQRELGVTYKTAWRMFKQIRLLLSDDGDINNLQGTVEVDETYMHPDKKKNSRVTTNGRYFGASQIIMGMVEQGGRARVRHIQSTGRRELMHQIKNNVQSTATVYSDGFRSYRALSQHGYSHSWIDHRAHQYLVDGIGTQNIENLWSQFKRGMYGVYRHCSPLYLQSYANEYAFRYTHRNTPAHMFDLFLGQIASTKFIRG
jgi:transposase-like protein